MANNPYVNKVKYGNDTVMDISDTTAEEGDVVSGKTFYKASGARSTGSAVIPDISNCYQTTDTVDSSLVLDDADYIPVYDDSASTKKNTVWSNIKAKLKSYFDTLYQGKLTFDDWPKKNSYYNPARSSGIYDGFSGTERLLGDTVGVVRKNLLRIPSSVTSTTISGVEFTVHRNSEGECIAIGAYGVATDYIIFGLTRPTKGLSEGQYIVSGCPLGGSANTYRIDVWDDNGRVSGVDTGDGCRIAVNAEDFIEAHIEIIIDEGTNMSTWDFQPIFFYPMLRRAEVISDKFYPYTSESVSSSWGSITGNIDNQTDLQNELGKKVITLTKAQYDALSTTEKNDPKKVYYVTDYEPITVAEIDDTTTALDKVWSSSKVSSELATNSWVNKSISATVGSAYLYVNEFVKLAMVVFNSNTTQANGTFTLPNDVVPSTNIDSAIRNNGYLRVLANNTTGTIVNTTQYSVGQILFPIN